MAQRAAARAMVRDAEEYANHIPSHLHGTMTVCPCGAETGLTCVAFGEEYRTPNFCPDCGKPSDRWGDTRPWRPDITDHHGGCRAHPAVALCDFCGEPMIGEMVADGSGTYHFAHAPGSGTWDPDLGGWRDRDGNLRPDLGTAL